MDHVHAKSCPFNMILISSLELQMTYGSSQGSNVLAPRLGVHLRSMQTGGTPWPNITPAVVPATLRVYAIDVTIWSIIPNEAQDVCNESAWTKFVGTALQFPRLRRVELRHRYSTASTDADYHREPAFLGITDEAFKPLIDAEKFLYQLLHWEIEDTVSTATDTVDDSQARARLARIARGPSSPEQESDAESDSDVEPEEAEEYFAEENSKHLIFCPVAVHTNICMQRAEKPII